MSYITQIESIVRSRWSRAGGIWKVLLVIFGVVAGLMVLVGLGFWLLGRFIGALSIGAYRNRDLYLPRIRRV